MKQTADIKVSPFPGTAADWDAFVRSAPGATACHLWGWSRPIEDVLGNRMLRLAAVDEEGRLMAVLPMARVKSRLFGDYLVSMPFLNDGGPVGTQAGREALIEAAGHHAREAGVDLLEIRSREPLPGDLSVTNRKITVILDLPADPETLWKDGLKSKVRSQVRRPMKEGMEVRFGPEHLDAFYDVFARNMRDLGTPVLPRAFFDAIVAALPETAVVGAVYHGERPAAVGFGLAFGDELEITWASSDRDLDRMAPNMLLYWGFMQHAIERGLGRFNFGRCTRGGGTHRFKTQWGGEDVDLPWGQWSARGVAATPTPEGGAMGLAVRVWQRLPLPVTNRLGPILSRRIP